MRNSLHERRIECVDSDDRHATFRFEDEFGNIAYVKLDKFDLVELAESMLYEASGLLSPEVN